MGAGATQKVLTVCQPEEVSISSKRGLVPWLCGILERHLHKKQKNQESQAVAWAPVSTKHPSLPHICQLLLAIHLEIQSDSFITYLDVKDFRENWV